MFILKRKEKICLNALKETCKKYQIDEYSIGSPCEQRVCICKRGDNWEVFIVERGIEFDKTKHKECIDACLEVLNHCSYSIDEFKDTTSDFTDILKNKHQKIMKKAR